MKSLEQVKPGIPVESLGEAPPYRIENPGHYLLTSPLDC